MEKKLIFLIVLNSFLKRGFRTNLNSDCKTGKNIPIEKHQLDVKIYEGNIEVRRN